MSTTADRSVNDESPGAGPAGATGPSRPARVDDLLRRRLTALVPASGSAPSVTSTAPFDGQPIAGLPQCSPDDVTAAAERARAAQARWARTGFGERAAVFLRSTTWCSSTATPSWT